MEAISEQEQYRQWVRRLYELEKKYQYDGWAVKPAQPYDYTYALTKPVVSDPERKELLEMIETPFFQTHQYDDALLEELDYHWTGGNATPGMTEIFWNAYAGADKNDLRLMMFREHMRAKRSYFERIPEYLCWEPYPYDSSTESAEFWYYYLMTAFGNRSVSMEIPEEDCSFIEDGMIFEGRKYLSGYLETIYQPSKEWRRRFVINGSSGDIKTPRKMQIRLCARPDQGVANTITQDSGSDGETVIENEIEIEIQIEFHFHDITFYWNGEPVEKEMLSFQELMQYAGKEGEEHQFILLLALTGIEECEHETACHEIRSRLEKLPIDGFCLDFVAACLADGSWAETDTSGGQEDSDAQEEDMQGLMLHDLKRMQEAEGKLIVVEGMSDLEKAQRICTLLKENCHQPSLRKWKNVCGQVDVVRDFLEKYAFLASGSVVLCYGDQDSIYFNKMLNVELYSEKAISSSEYAIGRKEKNYRMGEFWHCAWDNYAAVWSVGESGVLWYYEIPEKSKIGTAGSPAEVIANHYRLEDVTAMYYLDA